jgi:hypothetical protein
VDVVVERLVRVQFRRSPRQIKHLDLVFAPQEPCMCLALGLGSTPQPFSAFSCALISVRLMPIIHVPTTEHTLIHIP